MYNISVPTIKKLNALIVIFLFVFSLIIRLYRLNNLELFSDEIDVGYQAYSLLTTGNDYKGNHLPLYIDSFTESRAPFLIYTTVPSVAIFGLTPFAVRLPAVIFGSLAVVFFYLLVRKLTSKSSLAFIGAVFLSLTPWFFHYSTHAFEVSLLLFLTLAGTYVFFLFLDKFKLYWLALSILCFALTFYTYNTSNIFTPLIVLFLIVANFKNIFSRLGFIKLSFAALFSFLLILPILLSLFSGKAARRFSLISIFSDDKTISEIVFKRTGFSSSGSANERFFHNKAVSYTQKFTANYLNTFSFNYLFNTGDPNPRHTPPGVSLLPVIFLPLLIIGLFSSFSSHKSSPQNKNSSLLFLFWLLIGPISAALTIDGGTHATRSILVLPALIYYASLGFSFLINSAKFKFTIPIISLLFITNLLFSAHEYFTHYPKESFTYWNSGYQNLFTSLPANYNRLFISHTNYNSLLPFLFYTQYPPRNLQLSQVSDQSHPLFAEGLNGFNISPNIFFVTSWPGDPLDFIKNVSQSGDVFLLNQSKDIPGDMILNSKSMPQFININTIDLPNGFHLAQIIKKI